MLIVLPPSETKLAGGRGRPLDLDDIVFPDLTPQRAQLVDELRRLAHDLPAARTALAVTATKDDEIAWNAALLTAPTRPSLDRYTGVLYDNLDARTLTKVQRARADARVLIGSALFGVTRAGDRIPAYRLSAGSRLPGLPGLAAFWRAPLSAALAGSDQLVLDLRSGAYVALGPVDGAVTVSVVTEDALGQRTVVSHFSKATKGLLARALIRSKAELETVPAVIRAARTAGLRIERTSDRLLTVIT